MFILKERIGTLRITIFIFCLLFILVIWPGSAWAVANEISIDAGAVGDGTVDIAYQSDNPKRVKVMIQKDSEKYSYDLKTDGSTQSFPLRMGDGDYKVSVLENTQGTKYKYLKSETVSLTVEDQNSLYLNSIQDIDWDENSLAASEAEELTQSLVTDEEKVAAIYNYIVDNGSYDYNKAGTVQAGYIPDNDDTLSTNKGICYDFASLFASMTRSVDIPCKLVKGYADDVNGYHAWNEVAVNGEWIVVDTSADMQRRAAGTTYSMEKTAANYDKSSEY